MKTIRIAEEFSKHPAGRTSGDGHFNGERFRNDFLLPLLKSGEEVNVVLDGARSYGSSFLEEAFGGLVRLKVLSRSELKRRLHIIAEDKLYDTFRRRAENFMDKATDE